MGWLNIAFRERKDPVLGVQTPCSFQCPALFLARLPKFLNRGEEVWVDCPLPGVSWPWFLLSVIIHCGLLNFNYAFPLSDDISTLKFSGKAPHLQDFTVT